jgi:uncharacterized membrane protein HdeD (DUF308 family)
MACLWPPVTFELIIMAYVANPPLEPRLLLHALAKNWWLLLLRGICAIVFGVLTFVWPGITLLTLVLLYGAYALGTGALALLYVIGIYAILYGILEIWLSLRLRGHATS